MIVIDMIGQSPVLTNKGKGMWFERKQPFVGRSVTSLKTAAKETNLIMIQTKM